MLILAVFLLCITLDFSRIGCARKIDHYHNGPLHFTKLKYIDRFCDAN